ncbi:AfsR/SARP family transcriptional regulator [Micromonospora sp. NPDC003197]
MQFHVLGPLEAHTAPGVPVRLHARKPAALLAMLLLNANALVSIEHLINAIWHEQAVPASALRNLRSYVWRLRGELGDRLESLPGGYRLRVLPGELDTDQVTSLATAARLAMSHGAYAEAAGQLADALALWRGRPFDVLTCDAARSEAARLDDLRRDLRELLAEAWLALGRHTDATALLRDLVEEDPLREGTWARLVSALHRAGRPADALAAYDQARRVIVGELGIEPGPDLVAAQGKVLRGSETWQPVQRRSSARIAAHRSWTEDEDTDGYPDVDLAALLGPYRRLLTGAERTVLDTICDRIRVRLREDRFADGRRSPAHSRVA